MSKYRETPFLSENMIELGRLTEGEEVFEGQLVRDAIFIVGRNSTVVI